MILFTYDFPHKKTLDFIFYCLHFDYNIDAVIGAPKIKLPIPNQRYKAGVDLNTGVVPTTDLCKKLNIPYHVAPHNSEECLDILDEYKPSMGLIGGARILSRDVIDKFSKGIINFHPGPIPEARGLDTAQWIMYDDLQLGVTSHFIDGRVDGGYIIIKKDLWLSPGFTLQDVGVKLYLGQLEIFDETLSLAFSKDKKDFKVVPQDAKPSNKYFPLSKEEELMGRRGWDKL